MGKTVEVEGGLCYAEVNERHLGKSFDIKINEEIGKHWQVQIRDVIGHVQLLGDNNDNLILDSYYISNKNGEFKFIDDWQSRQSGDRGNGVRIKVPSIERVVSFTSGLIQEYLEREEVDLNSEKPKRKDFDFEID